MRIFRRFLLVALLLGATSCQGPGPVIDPPAVPPLGNGSGEDQNPVYLPYGPLSYGDVFTTMYTTLTDYGFDIAESNRYDGRIETIPRVSPGLGLFLKPGSPSIYDRLLSTMQTYRHRVTVIIMPAEQGGYFVEVIVRKELEDLPRPLRSTIGSAIFRNDNNVDRQFEVIDSTFFDAAWIYRGRDAALEQELIRRLKDATPRPAKS